MSRGRNPNSGDEWRRLASASICGKATRQPSLSASIRDHPWDHSAMEAPPEYSKIDTNHNQPSSTTRPDVYISIDFGTAFTELAYIPTAVFDGPGWTLRDIAQRLRVFSRWPDNTGRAEERVPSTLRYDGNQRLLDWGSVSPRRGERCTQVEYFKLGLEGGMGVHYGVQENDTAAQVLGGFITSPHWRLQALPEKAPSDFVAEFLSKVRQHFMEDYLPGNYGQGFGGLRCAYILTVPAIWQEGTKELFKNAAIQAGIDDTLMEFISEPEAAARYCATICNNARLETDDYFMVCDAGGGTVVIPDKCSDFRWI